MGFVNVRNRLVCGGVLIMSCYFLASPVSFFLSSIHGPRLIPRLGPAEGEITFEPNPDTLIPAEAIEISADTYAALLAGQAAGKVIAADSGGLPTLIDPAGPSHDEKMQRLRAERDRRILVADNRVSRYEREIRMGIDPTDDIAALDAYIQALADLPEVVVTQVLDPLDPPWPELPA